MIRKHGDTMKVLVFAPHDDDEVLGVGGTMAKYAAEGHEVYVCEVTTLLSDPVHTKQIREEAAMAHKILGVKDSFFLNLPVVALKDTPTIEVNARFLDIVEQIHPEVAFIPHQGDMHIDHSEVAKAAMVALRPISNPQLKEVYAYETLSETEWNIPSVQNAFIPNCYNDITAFIGMKKEAMACYKTQIMEFPHPRSLRALEALSELRGSTIGVSNAESFMLIRKKF